MKHKHILFVVITIVIILGGVFLTYQVSKSRTFQFFGGLTSKVYTNKKMVALTFDDAPTKYSDQITNLLKKKGVKATFYMIGKNIEAYPFEAKNIVNSGNELGNHSYSHQRMILKSLSFIDSEIQKTNFLIRAAGYNGEITFL